MKSIGITEYIPVNVVLASDEEAKKAALIAIMVKAKMHPSNVSKTLLEIYAAIWLY